MSAPEQVIEREQERLSSIKIVRNASGKVQIEVKRYAERNDQAAIVEAVEDAKRIYDELDAYYAPGGRT